MILFNVVAWKKRNAASVSKNNSKVKTTIELVANLLGLPYYFPENLR